MWHTIFRITDRAVTKRFDLLDVVFFNTAAFSAGMGIAQGIPFVLLMLLVGVIALTYLITSALVFYIRRICFESIDIADRMYWEHHR